MSQRTYRQEGDWSCVKNSALILSDEESDEYGLVILKSIQENGEELLSTLDSEAELTEIYNQFMEIFFEDEDK